MNDSIEELRIKELLLKSRNEEVFEITPLLIYKGMKYILTHENDEYEDFAKGLIELGCNFTLDEVMEFMKKNNNQDGTILSGLYEGRLEAGASIICNVRDSEYCKAYASSNFLERESTHSPVNVYMRQLKRIYGIEEEDVLKPYLRIVSRRKSL